MSTTKLNIGKIPISKGEYQEGTTYQRLNQVTMLGSTYQSKIDDNTSAPAQMGADGAVENINTDNWLCIAVGNVSSARKVVYNNETSGLEAGNVQEAIDETNTKLIDLSNKPIYDTSKNNTISYNTANEALDAIPKAYRKGYMLAIVRVNGVNKLLYLSKNTFSYNSYDWVNITEKPLASLFKTDENIATIASKIYIRALGYKLKVLDGKNYSEYLYIGDDLEDSNWCNPANWSQLAKNYHQIYQECCVKAKIYEYIDAETGNEVSGGNETHCVSQWIDAKNILKLKYTLTSPLYNAASIACYDKNLRFLKEKSLILKAGDTKKGIFDVDDSVSFIRVYYIKGKGSCSISPNEPYSYQKDLEETSKEISKIKESLNAAISQDVVCFGDSLTEGAGSSTNKPSTDTNTNVSYPAILGRLINDGRNVINAGCGGEPSWMVAARQGAEYLLCEPFTLPAGSTKIRVYIKGQEQDYFFKNNAYSFVKDNLSYNVGLGEEKGLNPCYIGGVKGILSRDLISSGSPDPTTGETVQTNTYAYYFTRAEVGDSITFDRPQYIIGNAYKNWRNYIQIFWCGANDAPSHEGSYITQPYDYKRIKLMAENLTTDRYIVMDLPTGNDVSRADAVQEFNQLFGSHYMNIRKYVSKYGIDIANKLGANIVVSESDKQAIQSGAVPSCLKIDGIHGNYWFYQIVARAVFDKGKSLGYW